MDHMAFYEKPPINSNHLIIAFSGWPDAAGSATGAVKHLIDTLSAKKCGEIDPEEFYNFVQTRPQVNFTNGSRQILWTANELFHVAPLKESSGLLLLTGIEPSLRWKTFARTIVNIAIGNGIKSILVLGSLLDAVPHSRPVRLTGSATVNEVELSLKDVGVNQSNYQGPTGIGSAIMEACKAHSIAYSSIWGHVPHYLQITPNYKVTYALLETITRLIDLPCDVADFRTLVESFDIRVEKAISSDKRIKEYVGKLENQHDSKEPDVITIHNSEDIVRDLEKFLNEQPGKD